VETIHPEQNNPNNVRITLTTDNDRVTRQDAAFYVGYVNPVAILTNDAGRTLAVRCVGEMRLAVWPSDEPSREDGDEPIIVWDSDGLIAAGITDDEKLLDAEDRLVWDNNAWFEVFDSDDSEDFGSVFHDLDDAINEAFEMLNELILPPRTEWIIKIALSGDAAEILTKRSVARLVSDQMRGDFDDNERPLRCVEVHVLDNPKTPEQETK
jgi:hypothetical protein